MKPCSGVAIAITAENRFEHSQLLNIQTHQLHVSTHPIRAHIASLTISESVVFQRSQGLSGPMWPKEPTPSRRMMLVFGEGSWS